MVMSLGANLSVNHWLRLGIPLRGSGMWKSSSSNESLKGVGPWPLVMLRSIFCIRISEGVEEGLVVELLDVPGLLYKNSSWVIGIQHISWRLRRPVVIVWLLGSVPMLPQLDSMW